ncbi:hypothetical protein DID88_004994 [Monilinia fructigena]|uniref:Uncharacterized protein n=1 Tax=Monilinia fructigena TaxID=38457 RepID=A0A395IS61_9HELO|nr:hypothetical protein DID88_004994 [Monilinia fructigena]
MPAFSTEPVPSNSSRLASNMGNPGTDFKPAISKLFGSDCTVKSSSYFVHIEGEGAPAARSKEVSAAQPSTSILGISLPITASTGSATTQGRLVNNSLSKMGIYSKKPISADDLSPSTPVKFLGRHLMSFA